MVVNNILYSVRLKLANCHVTGTFFNELSKTDGLYKYVYHIDCKTEFNIKSSNFETIFQFPNQISNADETSLMICSESSTKCFLVTLNETDLVG